MPVRIAIVDDHSLIRTALSDLLTTDPDLSVVADAADGATALAAVEQAKPDVLLLDIALPDGNGLDLIPRIAESSPDTHILILSMHAEPEYAIEAHERGALGLISKSAPIEELVRAIHAVACGEPIPIACELTDREREVLKQIGRGASNDEIAATLALRPKTIEAYTQRLMTKLGVSTRAGLVGHAHRLVP
jgi:two-component system response regulator NreC